MNDEKIIRKLYGEKMWHLCRSLFATLLDIPGLLTKLLEDHFYPSRFLCDDIIDNHIEEEFKDYIYSFVDVENNNEIITNKSVKELLSEAGYDFYECHTEQEIQAFKKYYSKGEVLCTFNGGRLDRCYVFFAVKKDVNNIKRENFSNPKREDEYGTSVISIQFTKGDKNTLSIKNRYNHTVNNPDATFYNNLDNIIPGLTNAFQREYNLNINQNEKQDFDIPGYVRANDDKWYKYNYEIHNICYCPDNIIIDNFEVIKDYQEKEKYLIFDYFVLDLVNKEIRLYDEEINDSFINCNKDIEIIDIKKIYAGKEINLIFKNRTNASLIVDNTNRFISYSNKNNVKYIGNNFLAENFYLIQLDLPNIENIGGTFLFNNKKLVCINLLNVTSIGNYFLYDNNQLSSINLPKVTSIGNYFLHNNTQLTRIDLPKVTSIGDSFLFNNKKLVSIDLPNATSIDDYFLCNNKGLTSIVFPSVISIGDFFLLKNEKLVSIDLPNVISIGRNFLNYNEELTSIDLLNVISIGNYFLLKNEKLASINLPNIASIGDYFLHNNDFIKNNGGKKILLKLK